MTEHEWLTATHPGEMLMSFPARWDARKLWLFGCACLRRAWHLFPDPRTRTCIEVAERYADSEASDQEVNDAWEAFNAAAEQDTLEGPRWIDCHEAIRNLLLFVDPAASLPVARQAQDALGGLAAEYVLADTPGGRSPGRTAAWEQARREEGTTQADLLRDIFANPFRPLPPTAPAVLQWNAAIVKRLAEQAYEHRLLPSGQLEPQRLAILADSLEEAGADAQLVEHLRGPGPHVRGCWAVDCLAGKT